MEKMNHEIAKQGVALTTPYIYIYILNLLIFNYKELFFFFNF